MGNRLLAVCGNTGALLQRSASDHRIGRSTRTRSGDAPAGAEHVRPTYNPDKDELDHEGLRVAT